MGLRPMVSLSLAKCSAMRLLGRGQTKAPLLLPQHGHFLCLCYKCPKGKWNILCLVGFFICSETFFSSCSFCWRNLAHFPFRTAFPAEHSQQGTAPGLSLLLLSSSGIFHQKAKDTWTAPFTLGQTHWQSSVSNLCRCYPPATFSWGKLEVLVSGGINLTYPKPQPLFTNTHTDLENCLEFPRSPQVLQNSELNPPQFCSLWNQ